MRNISDIKRRIKGVSDTRKITGAMETVSIVKMRKALARYENNKAYFETIRRVINEIVLYTHNSAHKVFASCENKCPAIIVIASDKGLAGGYNHAVLTLAERELEKYANTHLFTVGQMTAEYFLSRKSVVDETFADASFDPSIEQAAEMSDHIYKLFEAGIIDGAHVVFTAMGAHNEMKPQTVRLLPFDKEFVLREHELSAEQIVALRELSYEPSAEEVLAALIPQYLTGMLYGALIQSSACEHRQRRNAMSRATKNASVLLDALQSEYNKARQESVTNELTELVAAAGEVHYDRK